MDKLKEQAKWKIAPPDEMEENTNNVSCCDELEENDDSEYFHYWPQEMLAEDKLPKTGFLRLPDVLALIPVSKSTWWEGIQTGRFPKGYKIAEKTTAWDVNEIRALIAKIKCS